MTLFEYDKRFSIHGSDFVFYDYNHPTDLPENHKKQYNIVLADPPFLSEECLTKTTETIKLLAKDKIILCTGLFNFFFSHTNVRKHVYNFQAL